MRLHHRLFTIASLLPAVAMSGCAAMLPSPQMSVAQHTESVAHLAHNPKPGHFCGSEKCAIHRFLANGPATVAVAQTLHLGSWSPTAHHEGNLTGDTLAVGSTAAGLFSPVGAALFFLSIGQNSLPAWADHYQWMRKGTEIGEVLQVAQVYPLGADPRQASENAAAKLGQKALAYLGTLKMSSGAYTQVSASGYAQNWKNVGPVQFFVGTDKADGKGNLSMVWWSRSSVSGAAVVIDAATHTSFRVPRLGKLGHSPKGQGSDYQLSRVECMPIPGDDGQGIAVATILIEHPYRFTQSRAYQEAPRFFHNQYLVMTGTTSDPEIMVWHHGKAVQAEVPGIGH